jgi:hypothetical protein
MRTSAGRGADSWMMAIPIVALIIAFAMSAGSVEAVLNTFEGALRAIIAWVVDAVSALL